MDAMDALLDVTRVVLVFGGGNQASKPVENRISRPIIW